MYRHLLIILVAAALLLASTAARADESWDAASQVKDYAELVYRSYDLAHADALKLQAAVNDLLDDPTSVTLTAARRAWTVAKQSYGPTEAFRFYEGPIDFVDAERELEGPEGRLNAWPLNEAYIDYVEGHPDAGIINDTSIELTQQSIVDRNAVLDEADVTTGYHAIEFLLWGQDFAVDGPGNRSHKDYLKGDDVRDRRRAYLLYVTDLLVDDLKFLVDEWTPGIDNYRADFEALDQKEAVSHILTGIATLAGFELASERIAVPLDSGDQEDEHSCFSDTTHLDYISNAQGIYNVYFATVGPFNGQGMDALIAKVDRELNAKIEEAIKDVVQSTQAVTPPIDFILATAQGSEGRRKLEHIVTRLQTLADLLKEAGTKLGVDVVVAGE